MECCRVACSKNSSVKEDSMTACTLLDPSSSHMANTLSSRESFPLWLSTEAASAYQTGHCNHGTRPEGRVAMANVHLSSQRVKKVVLRVKGFSSIWSICQWHILHAIFLLLGHAPILVLINHVDVLHICFFHWDKEPRATSQHSRTKQGPLARPPSSPFERTHRPGAFN